MPYELRNCIVVPFPTQSRSLYDCVNHIEEGPADPGGRMGYPKRSGIDYPATHMGHYTQFVHVKVIGQPN